MTANSNIGATPHSLIAKPGEASGGGASRRGSHRLAAAVTCERLWALRYLRGIVPKTQKSFQLSGTLIHTHLAYWFADMLDEKPKWYQEKTLEEAIMDDGEGYPDLIRQAEEAAEAFKQHYAGEPWMPLAVEEEYVTTVGAINPNAPDDIKDEQLTCRVDLIAIWNGEAWCIDHKTQAGHSSSGRLAKWRGDGQFGLNWQVFQNLWILRTQDPPLPYPVRGFAINRVKRTQPFDFDRHALQPPEIAYNDAPLMITAAIQRERDIQARVLAGGKPTPNFAACHGRYGKCDYYDVCAARSKDAQARIIETEFMNRFDGSSAPLVQLGEKKK